MNVFINFELWIFFQHRHVPGKVAIWIHEHEVVEQTDSEDVEPNDANFAIDNENNKYSILMWNLSILMCFDFFFNDF